MTEGTAEGGGDSRGDRDTPSADEPASVREPPSVDDLVARLRERVDERRRAGEYPEGLEADLDLHFHHIAVRGVRDRLARLREAFAEADATGRRVGAEHIPTTSERRGGELVHRTVAAVVRRQVEGALDQVREYADALAEAHRAQLLAHADLAGTVDDIRDLLASADDAPDDTASALASLAARVDALEADRARRSAPRWEGPAPDAASRDALAARAAELLATGETGAEAGLVVAGPVVAAPAELAGALTAAGVGAVEPVEDPLLDSLASRGDASLDAAVLDGVLERLAPAEQLELVALLAVKLREGGRLVAGARNPHSLLSVAPEAAAPAHPAYLSFLLREAGFAEVTVERPTPSGSVPSSATSAATAGDADAPGEGGDGADAPGARDEVEGIVRHLGEALFGVRAVTLVATR